MKYIKTYENIMGYLKPKSLDQIKVALDNLKTLSSFDKIRKIKEYKILGLYSNDEIKEIINGIESPIDKMSKIRDLELLKIYTDDEIKKIINEITSPIYRLEYVFDKKLNRLFNDNEIKGMMSNETDYRRYKTIKSLNLRHLFTEEEFKNIIKGLLPNYKLRASVNDNYPEFFKEALEEGANLADDRTYLNTAIENNNPEMVKLILDDGRVNPNFAENFAILQAVDMNYYDIVKILMEDKRVDPSDRNNRIFFRAYAIGYKKIAKLLLTDKRVEDKLSTLQKKYYKEELENVNESIKDYLKPKSAEQIEKSLSGKSLYDVGKLYNKFMDIGKVSEHIIKHLPLIFQCHNEVLFNPKFTLHKYVDFEYKFTNHLLNTEDDFKAYYFNLVVRKNEDSFLVSQYKDKDYVYCSFTNPQTRKREATKLRSVKDFLDLLDNLGYLNESIKNYLKPRSEEDIMKSCENLPDKTKLLKGAEHGLLTLVKQVIENGFTDKDIIHRSLELAINNNDLVIAEYLIDHGADIHKYDDVMLYFTLMFPKDDDLSIPKLLIRKGGNTKIVYKKAQQNAQTRIIDNLQRLEDEGIKITYY